MMKIPSHRLSTSRYNFCPEAEKRRQRSLFGEFGDAGSLSDRRPPLCLARFLATETWWKPTVLNAKEWGVKISIFHSLACAWWKMIFRLHFHLPVLSGHRNSLEWRRWDFSHVFIDIYYLNLVYQRILWLLFREILNQGEIFLCFMLENIPLFLLNIN